MLQNKIILAIETATTACSVALKVGDELICRYEEGNNIHSQRLLEMIDSVFRETDAEAKDLALVAVGQGPGSFTGLRIGIGVAQGLAFAANCPMVGVSSLHALALRAVDQQSTNEELRPIANIVAGIDARMGEIYWAEFVVAHAEVQLSGSIVVSPPELVSSNSEAPLLVGNAWSEYAASVSSELLERGQQLEFIQLPRAREILLLAEQKFEREGGVSAAEFEADYVRNNVAKKSARKSVKK